MNDIGSDSNNDNLQIQQQEEEEVEEVDDDEFTAVDVLIPILHLQQQKDDGLLPLRTRNKINELANEFLAKLRIDVHDMLCDNFIDTDNYNGLDSDRDTKEEVENIIRFFPEVLSRSRGKPFLEYDDEVIEGDYDDEDCLYPIMLLAYADGLDLTNQFKGRIVHPSRS
jgi:hypothetical protein